MASPAQAQADHLVIGCLSDQYGSFVTSAPASASTSPPNVSSRLTRASSPRARSNRRTAQYAASVAAPLPRGRDTYRSSADYAADLDRLAADHPTLVKPLTLPHRTIEGRAST